MTKADELPDDMLEVLAGMRQEVYNLTDLKDFASDILKHLQEKGYDLTLESDGSILAVKTEYL